MAPLPHPYRRVWRRSVREQPQHCVERALPSLGECRHRWRGRTAPERCGSCHAQIPFACGAGCRRAHMRASFDRHRATRVVAEWGLDDSRISLKCLVALGLVIWCWVRLVGQLQCCDGPLVTPKHLKSVDRQILPERAPETVIENSNIHDYTPPSRPLDRLAHWLLIPI